MNNGVKKLVGLVGALFFSLSAHSSEFSENDAKRLVFDFSRVATCSYLESPDDLLAVKLVNNEGEFIDQLGERFAVAWYSDVQCAGGSGTSTWQMSFVEVGSGNSLFVDLDQPPVPLSLLYADTISVNGAGNIVVEGGRYDPREGSGNQDFVNKTVVISPEGEHVDSILHINGEEYPEAELDTY